MIGGIIFSLNVLTHDEVISRIMAMQAEAYARHNLTMAPMNSELYDEIVADIAEMIAEDPDGLCSYVDDVIMYRLTDANAHMAAQACQLLLDSD